MPRIIRNPWLLMVNNWVMRSGFIGITVLKYEIPPWAEPWLKTSEHHAHRVALQLQVVKRSLGDV